MTITAAGRGGRLTRCGIALFSVFVVTGCHPYRVRSQLVTSPAPPETLYRCLQLELGRAEYAIVGADRASGWLHAQKRKKSFLGGVSRAEIYATVIPDEESGGAHLQLTDNSHAADDAERIKVSCRPD